MGQWEQASCYLNQKLQILKQLAANTETQYRFIPRREMNGLGRVLDEREVLLKQLAALNHQLAKDQSWEKMKILAPLLRDVSNQEQRLIERSKEVLQDAMNELRLIAAELKNSKVQRQVNNQYVNPWTILARGGRINAKG